MSLTVSQMNQISLVHYGTGLTIPQEQPQADVVNPDVANPPTEAQPPRAAQSEINRLMQSIARETYSEVTSGELAQRARDLVRSDRKALQQLADRAEAALQAIKNLKVRDIVNATDNTIEKLFNTAADLQFELANKLREVALKSKYQKPKFDGYRNMLDDFSLTCDSRGSEILTLFMEIKTFSEAQAIGTGSGLADATAANLLKGMAGSMHGNDKSLLFKSEADAIEKSLAAFSHSTTVDPNHLINLLEKTNQLSANLKKPEVAQTMDPAIHAKLTARLDSLQDELNLRADHAVKNSVNALFKKTVTLNTFGQNVASFLAHNNTSFPVLSQFVALLVRIENTGIRDDGDFTALEDFLQNPSLQTDVQNYLDLPLSDKPDVALPEDSDQSEQSLFLEKIGFSEDTYSMAKRVAAELRERRAAWANGGTDKLSGEDVVNAFRNNAKVSMLIEARVNGANENDLNPQLCDENLVDMKRLGAGAANTVYKMTYKMEDGSTKDFVFKPDLGGRIGFQNLRISARAYSDTQQAVKHNTATCDVAAFLGLDRFTGRNYATVHNGQYGLLMEMAPGTEAAKISTSRNPDVRRKFTDQKIVGALARELNDLRWLDLATGQGDRHVENYLVDFGADGKTPRVTAIDNDLSFTPYLVGVGKFNVNYDSQRLNNFSRNLRDAFKISEGSRGRRHYEAYMRELQANNYIVDTKHASKEVLCALNHTFGFHSVALPKQMSRALHDKLTSLTDDQIQSFALKLQQNIDRQEAIDATVQRLKDLREIARAYENEGKIVEDEAWLTDKNVLKRETTLDFPIGPFSTIVDKDAAYTTASILSRDFDIASNLVN